jgi:hypothetical protein
MGEGERRSEMISLIAVCLLVGGQGKRHAGYQGRHGLPIDRDERAGDREAGLVAFSPIQDCLDRQSFSKYERPFSQHKRRRLVQVAQQVDRIGQAGKGAEVRLAHAQLLQQQAGCHIHLRKCSGNRIGNRRSLHLPRLAHIDRANTSSLIGGDQLGRGDLATAFPRYDLRINMQGVAGDNALPVLRCTEHHNGDPFPAAVDRPHVEAVRPVPVIRPLPVLVEHFLLGERQNEIVLLLLVRHRKDVKRVEEVAVFLGRTEETLGNRGES